MTAVKIAINLPVRAREKSIKFFTSLGFGLNDQLTNDNVACIIISDDISAMLVSEPIFETISQRKSPDTCQQREVIVQLMVESRARVDELVNKALAAGGRPVNEPNDMGYLYGRSFQDIDGHMWDVFHVRQ